MSDTIIGSGDPIAVAQGQTMTTADLEKATRHHIEGIATLKLYAWTVVHEKTEFCFLVMATSVAAARKMALESLSDWFNKKYPHVRKAIESRCPDENGRDCCHPDYGK